MTNTRNTPRVRCTHCGKVTAGQAARGSAALDSPLWKPRYHVHLTRHGHAWMNRPCPGSQDRGEIVANDAEDALNIGCTTCR